MLRWRRRARKDEDELVHVIFPLEVDEHGWPPVGSERVWAAVVGPDLFRIENAPWFARGVAEGDVVRAVAAREGEWPEFVELVSWSGNCNIRVVPFREGELQGDLSRVLDLFAPLGVTGEGAGTDPIVALTITPDLDLAAVKALLLRGQAEGWWDYEEGCIGGAWLDL